MDIEALRTYCLSLSPEVEEKFPFQKFRAARDVLVFYIGGHMFCYFDINDLSRVSMKCSEEEAILLREQYDCIGLPYNANKNFANRTTLSFCKMNYMGVVLTGGFLNMSDGKVDPAFTP